ncbi:hypothetical protein DD238_005348 [Peronospora effusa]|uniref:Uncharacterized protein n=1 Tax=Peronospora effusa TaxID=542832 RepID=A0A3M6VIX3_9STRA|nr:hypothetical protein DD238_005348 [Peronospora effusa]
MTADDNDGWDEWEDDASPSPPLSLTGSDNFDCIEKTQTYPAVSNLSSDDDRKWGFDLSELEHEMMNVPPITPLFSNPDAAQSNEEKLLLLYDDVPKALKIGRERMQVLQALALVTRVHVLAVRGSCTELVNHVETPLKPLKHIIKELKQLAGEWGDENQLETTLKPSERHQLEKMTDVLYASLSEENENLMQFQEVFEHVFETLPDQKLVMSTNWLNAAEMEETKTEKMSYVQQILAVSSNEAGTKSHIPTLSDAEILQDAKDIGRDELLINGIRVGGAKGYDAVVDALQRELELVLARQVGMTPEQTPMAVSNALQSVAMAVVHASNRTESGGCSYELLSKFLSNHKMNRVLLRPDSARAAPLEVYLDMGPYLETIPGSNESIWAFGLRVKLVAVTWYLLCDAEDPTTELYEIETTFCNRLAFSVGLTPFHPLDTMRKDCGNVIVRFVRPCK